MHRPTLRGGRPADPSRWPFGRHCGKRVLLLAALSALCLWLAHTRDSLARSAARAEQRAAPRREVPVGRRQPGGAASREPPRAGALASAAAGRRPDVLAPGGGLLQTAGARADKEEPPGARPTTPVAKALLGSQPRGAAESAEEPGQAGSGGGGLEVLQLSLTQGGASLAEAVARNTERLLLAVDGPGVEGAALGSLRPAVSGALRGAAFRFLVWQRGAGCLQPLSRWEEDGERVGERSGGRVLVATTPALGLPAAEQWPPAGLLFWQSRPPLPPGGRLAAMATGRLNAGLVCRRWATEQLLHAKIARERSFWVGLRKGPPYGDNAFWATEVMGEDAMQYFGWQPLRQKEAIGRTADGTRGSPHRGSGKETDEKPTAAMVIRGGWDWDTMFLGTRPGFQLIMRHPHNNNLTAKDLLYWNLRNAAREALAQGGRPCVPVERMVPMSFLADDPEDCQRLSNVMRRSPGQKWVRKVADLHVGMGITPLDGIQAGDCDRGTSGPYRRASKIVYQKRMEPFAVGGRPTSLRSYVLLASLEPMVLLFNHHAGHMYIAGQKITQSDKAWYTQHHSFDAWTFEQFNAHMAREHQRPDFFWSHTLPNMKDAVLSGLKAARSSFTPFPKPAAAGPPRIWDTGHELGSLGRWDLWCIDFMYDANLEMRMLEMTDSCLFKGYREHEQVKQRTYMMRDSIELTVDIQSRLLQHQPIMDLFPAAGAGGAPATTGGSFELLYSEAPGAEYDYLEAQARCQA
eukprot:jgi/Tetstr1/429543/TSEL_019448.t2